MFCVLRWPWPDCQTLPLPRGSSCCVKLLPLTWTSAREKVRSSHSHCSCQLVFVFYTLKNLTLCVCQSCVLQELPWWCCSSAGCCQSSEPSTMVTPTGRGTLVHVCLFSCLFLHWFILRIILWFERNAFISDWSYIETLAASSWVEGDEKPLLPWVASTRTSHWCWAAVPGDMWPWSLCTHMQTQRASNMTPSILHSHTVLCHESFFSLHQC